MNKKKTGKFMRHNQFQPVVEKLFPLQPGYDQSKLFCVANTGMPTIPFYSVKYAKKQLKCEEATSSMRHTLTHTLVGGSSDGGFFQRPSHRNYDCLPQLTIFPLFS